MERYTCDELDTKINTFLSKKFEQYPDIARAAQGAQIFTKPSFPERLARSLTSDAK